LSSADVRTADGYDRCNLTQRAAAGEASLEKQARAKLIMCLGLDMLSLVEETNTAQAAFEALLADHLGPTVVVHTALLAEVSAIGLR
jgi:hypothetical protein